MSCSRGDRLATAVAISVTSQTAIATENVAAVNASRSKAADSPSRRDLGPTAVSHSISAAAPMQATKAGSVLLKRTATKKAASHTCGLKKAAPVRPIRPAMARFWATNPPRNRTTIAETNSDKAERGSFIGWLLLDRVEVLCHRLWRCANSQRGIGISFTTGAARATRPVWARLFVWSGVSRAPQGAPFPVGGMPIVARPATLIGIRSRTSTGEARG